MREVKPYKTEGGLLKALDNGGRFFNIFTKAGDDKVTRAELAKAAGVFGSAPKAVLYFEMAQQTLGRNSRTRAMAALGPKARKDYKKFLPTTLRPSAVESKGKAGACVIVEGFPRHLTNKAKFTGMMMLPVLVGSVTTFMMVPLYDQFDVYEVFDNRRMQRPYCILATSRGVKFPTGKPVRLGGILRKMEAEKDSQRQHKFYLEACYYTRLPAISTAPVRKRLVDRAPLGAASSRARY
ncbi:MAG: hypothetical protein ACYTHJ_16685 [Planctomycetota bacterium]|jgi:hypothetical protein